MTVHSRYSPKISDGPVAVPRVDGSTRVGNLQTSASPGTGTRMKTPGIVPVLGLSKYENSRLKDQSFKMETVLKKNPNVQYFSKNQYGLVPVQEKKKESYFQENNQAKKAFTFEKKTSKSKFFCIIF